MSTIAYRHAGTHKNCKISNIPIPELPSKSSSQYNIYQMSLERLYSGIERLETTIISKGATIQMSKLQTQNKELSGSRDHIMWGHVVSSDDVEEGGI